MKGKNYKFGYLFVKFSKVLAILALVTTLVSVSAVGLSYMIQAPKNVYRANKTLELQCQKLEEDLKFAKSEVSRIVAVDDLELERIPSAPKSSNEFESLQSRLERYQQIKLILKDRTTTEFTQRMEVLRGRIRSFIERTEASRSETRGEEDLSDSRGGEDRFSEAAEGGSQQSLFNNLEVGRVNWMHDTLNRADDFLNRLEEEAEQTESKRVIKESRAALDDLIAFLPRASMQSQSPQPASAVDSTVRSNTLTNAIQNYQNLGRLIEDVNLVVHQDWRLDATLFETTRIVDVEAEKCRTLETELKSLRWGCLGQAGRLIVGGLVVSFLILVFADFLQSFFDTASNSAIIRKRLEEQNL